MKHNQVSLAIVGILLGTFTQTSRAVDVQERCWGSEGPKPLIEMGSLAPKIRVIPTEGSVQEFIFWENKNAIIYRNDRTEVRGTFLNNGWTKNYGTSTYPLSKVTDPRENFLLALGLGWIWDVFQGRWKAVGPKRPHLDHLYWEQDRIYSAEKRECALGGGYRFDFFRYGKGDAPSAKPFCTWTVPVGSNYSLAHGSEYPYVFLHSSEVVRNKRVLKVAKLDLSSCEIVTEYNYTPYPIDGNIVDVYRYEDIDAMAVRTDHPSRNFLWDDGSGTCHMYDIQAESMAALHTQFPILAAWSDDDGLSIVSLKDQTAKRAKIVNVVPVERLVYKDFWLTRDGKRLFFSPRFDKVYNRPILEIGF